MTTLFYHDFRGKPLPAELTKFNVEEDNLLKVEPEGLHINIPPTFIHQWGGVGLRTAFGLKGDFEVIATIEILKADTPPAGYGVGVGLFVAQPDVATGVSRLVRADGNPMVMWDLNDNKKVKEGRILCSDLVGRLRLKRIGPILSYSWAPGTEGGDYQEINQIELGAGDIERVRLVALNGRTPTRVDVRFLDLRIRGNSTPLASPTFSAAKGGVSLALLVGLAFTLGLIIVVGTWVYVRGRTDRPSNKE